MGSWALVTERANKIKLTEEQTGVREYPRLFLLGVERAPRNIDEINF